MPYKKILADNLYLFRKSESISQSELGFRTDISKETISLIERESYNVSLELLTRICAYTGLTIPELFTEGFVENEIINKRKTTV